MNHIRIAQLCCAGFTREDDIEELARETQIPAETIRAIFQSTSTEKSLNKQLNGNAGTWG